MNMSAIPVTGEVLPFPPVAVRKPTADSVLNTHAKLLDRLSALKPHKIGASCLADPADLDEYAAHVESVIGAFEAYLMAIGLDIADQFLDDFGIAGWGSQLYLTGFSAHTGKEMARAADTSAQDVSFEQPDGGPAQAQ